MADLADISAQLQQDRSSRSERLAALRQQVRWFDNTVCLSDAGAIFLYVDVSSCTTGLMHADNGCEQHRSSNVPHKLAS